MIRLLPLLLLTGCAEWYAVKSGVGSYGAEAADEILDTALWTICEASTTGAIKRRFKTDEEKQARDTVCQ